MRKIQYKFKENFDYYRIPNFENLKKGDCIIATQISSSWDKTLRIIEKYEIDHTHLKWLEQGETSNWRSWHKSKIIFKSRAEVYQLLKQGYVFNKI